MTTEPRRPRTACFLLVLLAAVCIPVCAAPVREEAAFIYLDADVVGTIDTPGLVELSGLASSRIREAASPLNSTRPGVSIVPTTMGS